ncbi:hypothetical protein Tcan_09965 [Toxocara canis]|uniref:Uncharacterized protein n=1 Tax=Toxocara canis TaxID=6265 RepID=A0A0B2V8L5_TOXCA|nr:hypothetical protein Tcan_09965 [Toxocara canis]
MSPSSKLPSPSTRPVGSDNQSYHTAVHSKLLAPTRIHARETGIKLTSLFHDRERTKNCLLPDLLVKMSKYGPDGIKGSGGA